MNQYRTVNRLATLMAMARRYPHLVDIMARGVKAPDEWGWPDATLPRNGLGDKEPARPPAQRARY